MEQVKASYGYEVTKVPEGNRITYWKAKYPTRAILAILPFSLIAGIASLFIPWVGLLLGLLFLFGPVTYALWSNRQRAAIPHSFVISPDSIVTSERSFLRKDISKFYIRDLTGELSDSLSASGGGYFVGGTGTVGTAMAVGAAATHALGQAGRASGASARRAYEASNIKIRFTYGEKDFDLVTGLDAPRADALFNRLESLLEAKA